MEPNILLTRKQKQLLELIETRHRNHLPMVQQDLAEALGIRRDSVNKLLARTRRRLGHAGQRLTLPDRRGRATAQVAPLLDGALV